MTNDEYLKLSEKTATIAPHFEVVSGKNLIAALNLIKTLAKTVDIAKKGLFYGKFPKSPVQQEMWSAGETPETLKNEQLLGMIHGVLGLVTETAEIAEALLLRIEQGQELDKVNIVEEIGDLEWYMAMLYRTIGGSPEQAKTANIAKLKARYGDKFSEEAAITRNTKEEYEIMTNVLVPHIPG
jgi:NTP pyrophosphatase (non-canonical NTP hydrolase)